MSLEGTLGKFSKKEEIPQPEDVLRALREEMINRGLAVDKKGIREVLDQILPERNKD